MWYYAPERKCWKDYLPNCNACATRRPVVTARSSARDNILDCGSVAVRDNASISASVSVTIRGGWRTEMASFKNLAGATGALNTDVPLRAQLECEGGGWRTEVASFKNLVEATGALEHRRSATAQRKCEGAASLASFAKGADFDLGNHVLEHHMGLGAHKPFSPFQ